MDLLSMIAESRNRFTPLSLSPVLWLDASDGDTLYDATTGGGLVSIGSPVARWEDKSNNGNHFLQSTPGKQPVREASYLDFDGSDDSMEIPSIPLNAHITVFFVGEFTTAKPFFLEHSANANTNDGFFFYGTSNSAWLSRRNDSSHYALGTTSWAGSAKMIGSLSYNGTGSYYKNGLSQNNSTVTGSATSNTLIAAALNLAARNNGSDGSDGNLHELLIFNTPLSDTDRQRVEAYLSSKWGIPTYDSDALDYFNRVEAAGSTINATNKNAINQFIVGCKEDGNWTKIKASCILAGADTLTGALVPLVGTAPTNVGFLSDDYSTTGGLIGNGSTKYLNSNRANNADPQDNSHLAVYVNTAPTSIANRYPIYIGAGSATVGESSIGRNQNNGSLIGRFKSSSLDTLNVNGNITGTIAISRSLSASYLSRNNQSNTTITRTSQNPIDWNLFVFATSFVSGGTLPEASTHSNARISFYSIGESINIGLLDTRLARLMNSLRSSSYDADALAYFAAITAAGSSINENNKNAVNEFIIGCKADGNWNKIKASCILAGADNLTGALVPLVGTAPTNFNFPEENYSRTNGLISNGTSSYLNSNRNDSADTKDNASMCLCITQHSNDYFYYASRVNFNGAAGRVLGRSGSSGVVAMCNNGGAGALTAHSRTTATLPAFVGISRSNADNYSFRYGEVTDTVVKTSSNPEAAPIHIFKQGNNGAVDSFSNVRLSFYSIGEALVDLALLDIRVTKLMNSLI